MLIVAADFKPTRPEANEEVVGKAVSLAEKLRGTGVYLKMNSVLRSGGYPIISNIHYFGVKVFADLKFFDIPETLAIDGMLLREFKPELATVACSTGVKAIQFLKTELPDTELLGVTILTSFNEDDSNAMFTCSTEEAVLRLAGFGQDGGVNGYISSGKEAEVLRAKFGLVMSLNTPAIRPAWAIIPGDDQNPDRIMTPAKAIKAGADRIVVGRPITQAPNPYDAVMRTIDEIASACP